MGAIGIDLGTTNSCVGIWKNNKVEIIPNELGNTTTPSCVAFTDNQPLPLVGDAAQAQLLSHPTNTIFDAKRLIGRRFSDEAVQSGMKLWPFEVVSSGSDDKPLICVTYKGEKKQFAAEEICSMVLKKMKQMAELYTGGEVKNAVITVPAFFNHSQRQATVEAAETAGIHVLRIINEPVAAAIAFGFHNSLTFTKKKKEKKSNFPFFTKKKKAEKNERDVLIFDLSSTTLDLTIVGIKDGGLIEVKATARDTHLGGADFDKRMVSHLIEELKRKHKDMNSNISEDPKAMRRLSSACEKAKRMLSYAPETRIDIDCLFEGIDCSETISRDKFEELNADVFIKCMVLADECLRDARLDEYIGVDDVILVGGSSRIPKLQKLLCKLLNQNELCTGCGTISPNEVVAYGAAVQAAAMNGEIEMQIPDLMPIKSTPLSLGIEIHSGQMRVVIPRNTRVPARKGTSFYYPRTSSELRIRVFQGQRVRARDNILLGEFVLRGIELGTVKDVVDVFFELQGSGNLRVYARDRKTGKREMRSMEMVSLSRHEIRVMREETLDCVLEDFRYIRRADERTDFILFWNIMRQYFREETVEWSWGWMDKAEDEISKLLEWSAAHDEPAERSEYKDKTRQLMSLFFPLMFQRMNVYSSIRERVRMHKIKG